jgi:hypothetical protein
LWCGCLESREKNILPPLLGANRERKKKNERERERERERDLKNGKV